MKYQIDETNNFCRVFQLPDSFPEKYCFSGGIPCTFKMVDWFNPVNFEQAPVITGEAAVDKIIESLSKFIKGKTYYNPGFSYILICDFGLTFSILPKNHINESDKND